VWLRLVRLVIVSPVQRHHRRSQAETPLIPLSRFPEPALGSQTYMLFDYVGKSGVFSQDVSALSHEMGEWLDDPYTNNNSPCGIYEVGDPLEGESNYGDYAYVVGGSMTYHLQDLAQPPYFGAPASTSLGGRATFQGTSLGVCANGS
jgi:hypothetical protein